VSKKSVTKGKKYSLQISAGWRVVFFILMISTVRCTRISPINDRPPNIAWVDTELNPVVFVYNYYDSIASTKGWNNPPNDWRHDFIAEMDDVARGRIYSLDTPGVVEMYHVVFVDNMIITSVYTENHQYWRNGNEVSEEEKVRIKQRFNDEVLKRMEEYAIQNKLPDSIVYVRKKR
jgi:hypothetical protein